jgi:dethiobiotin synthetase
VRLVVVGTGTSVGKTHVACALIHAWAARGVRAIGLKPIESGVPSATEPDEAEFSDQARLWSASQAFHVKRDRSAFHVKRSFYAFPDAVSPHLAARIAGRPVDLGAVRQWVDEHAAPVTVIETAGGLFSPLSDTATNLELLCALGPDAVLLVAPDQLGVLHDVTTTLGLAQARGVRIQGLALCAPQTPDASTGQNALELARLSIAAPLTVFPRAPADDPASLAAADPVLAFAEAAVHGGQLL